MSPELIKRIFDLARRTGERLVVVDPMRTGDAFVIMGLSEYESLRNSQPPTANRQQLIVNTDSDTRRTTSEGLSAISGQRLPSFASGFDAQSEVGPSEKIANPFDFDPPKETPPFGNDIFNARTPDVRETEERFYLEPLEG